MIITKTLSMLKYHPQPSPLKQKTKKTNYVHPNNKVVKNAIINIFIMHKPKTVQPLTPSPEDDLQEISMLEDQFLGDDYRNLFSNRNNHNFIEGWIKPSKKASTNLISFKSNVL